MVSNFCDYNLSNPGLKEASAGLGFAHSKTPAVIFLKDFADLSRLNSGQKALKPVVGVVIESENGEVLRQAVKSPKVAFVCPLAFKEFAQDDGLVRAVAEAGKAFEIPLSFLLLSKHVFRAKALSQLKEFCARCKKLGAPIVFTSRAKTEFDLKSPREMVAIATLLGFTREQAAKTMQLQENEESICEVSEEDGQEEGEKVGGVK